MLVALIARDKAGALDVRKANREAHLDYAAKSGIVSQAGPLLNDSGDMCGSLLVLEVEDMAAARSFADSDPYAKAGLFDSVELIAWKKVI